VKGGGIYARVLAAALALFFSLVLPVAAHGDAISGAAAREVQFTQLPPEARDTIALIRKGGPFHHERDGIPFGNFEKRLPVQARGYYREYTVKTPGVRHRGARRIVAGRGGELYYTDDHYQSFRRIREP
jgi:ribonuclease T1